MKTALKVFIILLIIVGAIYWFFLRSDQDIYTLENAILIAEQGECAEYGLMINGTYDEDYGIWYLDIEADPEDDDYMFVYSCEVKPYSNESKLIVDKAINWYEDNPVDPVEDPIDDEPVADPVVDDELTLTLEEAQLIANSSECTEIGRLTGENDMYNNSTQTWWLGLHLFPEEAIQGCNPACVVYESDLHAEVNWRCTGALGPSEVIDIE
ncbi:MAG: hypothetical protein ABIH67_05570 [Candidatus Uhrbacteria bacterium]